MYKISTESLSLFLKTMKVGLLQIFFKKPFAKKRNKTTNNMNKQGGKCVLLFLSFFSFSEEEVFFFVSTGGGRTDRTGSTLNTTGTEMKLNQSHLLSFFLSTKTWLHALHLQWSPPFFLKSEDHLRRKHLHWTDNKRQFSSTKGSLVAIITVWQVSHTVKHQ